MNGVQSYLQQIVDRANGPGVLNIKRVQLWDLYSTKPMYNDTNLAGQNFTLFDMKPGDAILPINGVAGTSPLYQVSDADTNIDSPGNIPFDVFIHGLGLEILNRQHTPGTVGTVNDLAFWWTSKQAFLSDIYAKININELDVDRLTWVDAPYGGGPDGFSAMGTTAALTVGASIAGVTNGQALAGNYRSYFNEGPFFCKTNSTIKFNGTFGRSLVSANMVYKPANTGAAFLFLRATFKCFRMWWAQ
jgi:hypothetical protein